MKTRTKHFNKFFSFLLAMLLVVGMLPTTALAATTIDTVSINGVITPYVYENCAFGDLTVPTGATYEIENQSTDVGWYEHTAPLESLPAAPNIHWRSQDYGDNRITCMNGNLYTVVILLKAKNGHEFASADNMTCSINGEPAKVQTWFDGDKIAVYYTFTPQNKVSIDGVSITNLSEPALGNIVQWQAPLFPDGANYSLDSEYGFFWVESDSPLMNSYDDDLGYKSSNQKYNYRDKDSFTFKEDKYYAVSMTLKADWGYTFKLNPTATINGKAAQVHYNPSDTISVYYVYGKLNVGAEITPPTFETVEEGYNPVAAKPISIKATGANFKIDQLALTNSQHFTLNNPSGIQMAWVNEANTSFTIKPKDGLPSGTYSTEISVFESTGHSFVSNTISFVVKEKSPVHTLSTFSHVNDVEIDGDESKLVSATVTSAYVIESPRVCLVEDGEYKRFSDVELDSGNVMKAYFNKNQIGKTFVFGAYDGTEWFYSNEFTIKAKSVTPPIPTTDEYSIKVNSGKATIGAGNEVTKAKESDVVTITANAAPEGKVFDKWEVVSGSVALTDANAEETTFTMPGEAVEVTATYKEAVSLSKVTSVAVDYTGFVAGQPIANASPTTATTGVSVSNYEWAVNGSGTLGANFEADTDYKLTIYLKAADGYTLDELTNDSITVNGAKPYSSGKTMGTDVAKGDYQIVVYPGTPEVNAPTEYSIKVNSGKATIGAGSEIDKAKENDVITITADAAPEGKEFDKWEVVSGTVTLADANAEETTFTMPGEAVEVTATYKDKAVTPPSPVTYTITKGNGQTVTKGNTANFVSNAPFDKFVKVQVDGADVAASNYTAVSGSTDVTFTTDYINSLSEGNHTIAIVSNDGQAAGGFTVKAASVTPPHSHDFGTEWKSDADNHWKECSCGEKSEQAAHSFKWVTDKEATKDKDGSKHEECTVCGYKKDAVKIPATGNDKPTEPTKPTDPTKPTKPTDSTSPKTGDTSNILLWFAIFFISGGAATVLGIKSKKRKVQE